MLLPNRPNCFDASCHNIESGIGVLVISPQGHPIKFMYILLRKYFNNEAEYEALIIVLES